VTRLYARSNAEAHLYMDLRPCGCGDIEFARRSAVTDDGGVLCSRYDGPCRSCGAQRSFLFELPETIRPIREGTVDFGGDDPSRLLDPGEWLAVADYFAKLDPGTSDDLDIAAAAVAEVLKFIPRDAERVPDEAFRTDRGRAVRDLEPGRFRRPRLEAVLGAYRELLAKHRAPPAPAVRLDDQPVAALIDALATALARQHGFTSDELRRRVSDLTGQLTSVARRFEIAAREDQARKQTSAEVERILDGIVQTGSSTGVAIAAHRDAISQALRGVDLVELTDRLRVIVDWMRDPSETRSADDLIAKLEARVSAMVDFPDPLAKPAAPPGAKPIAREKSDALHSLDQLFPGARKDSK
jgi:hypothetical protein